MKSSTEIMEEIRGIESKLQLQGCSKDFWIFRNRYIKHDCETPEFHVEIIDSANSYKRVVVISPRNSAKSTLCSVDYVLWKILTGCNKVIIISDTGSLAEEHLSKIKKEIESNAKILADFGDQKTDKWTQDHIKLKIGSQVKAKGVGYQVRGFRANIIIADDLENDENVRSEDQRDKLNDYFYKALLNVLEPNDQLIVIGTLIHPFALLSQIYDTQKTWKRLKYAAIKKDGTALWEAKWSLERLAERKQEIGTHAFMSEFMNQPLVMKDAIINRDWLQYYEGYPRKPQNSDGSDAGLYPMHYYTAIDPAVSIKDSADYSAITTIGMVSEGPEKGRMYVVRSRQGHWSEDVLIQNIMDEYKRFKSLIGIEVVAFQMAIKNSLIRASRISGLFMPIVELKADKDKVRRFLDISAMIENGYIKFHRSQVGLLEQISMMTKKGSIYHDDLLDSFVYACKMCQERPRAQMKEIKKIVLPSLSYNQFTGAVE